MNIIIPLVGLLIGVSIGYGLFRYVINGMYKTRLEEAEHEAEVVKEKKLLEVKEKFLNKKSELEKEVQQRNSKIQQVENKLKQRELGLNQRQEEINRKKKELDDSKEKLESQQKALVNREIELDRMHKQEQLKLEELSGLSAEEAKSRLVESLKDEARTNAQQYINDIMDDAKLTANKEAKRIVIQTIQRVATETAIENSVTVFHIDNDEVKGRIIGREGRNIRALEAATGVEIVVDDTPEAIVISAFDPVRREVCRLALHQLISDGRIHPARIEEVVAKAQLEVEESVLDAAEQAILEVGIPTLPREVLKVFGRLKFRTSFGQNILQHSIEVAHIAAALAAEIGANVDVAKRAALLHDIGKAFSHEQEGSHALNGGEFLRKFSRESEIVINAVEAHHNEVEQLSIEAVLVQAADSISASRPGARRETLSNYLKRLEQLEEIANSHEGIESSYAIQAGRELRLIVHPDNIDDDKATILARDVAKEIEEKMQYPGQIKVTVIRETRAVEYAK